MQSRIPLIVAIVFGLIAFFGIWQYLPDASAGPEQMEQVLVVSRNVTRGQSVHVDDLEVQTAPRSALRRADGSRLQVIQPDQRATLVGGRFTQSLRRGDLIFSGFVDTGMTVESAPPFHDKITPGKRAISIPIDNAGMVTGFIQPEDRVDILANLEIREIREQEDQTARFGAVMRQEEEFVPTTVYMFQNIKVLAVGSEYIPGASNPRTRSNIGNTVTIEVSPQKAQILSFAMRQGGGRARSGGVTFTLLLRRQDDDSQVRVSERVDHESLLEMIRSENIVRQGARD